MTIFYSTDIFGWAALPNPLRFYFEIEFNPILDLLCTWFYKVHKFCFFDSKCFSFRIWKVEEYRIFAIICVVRRVIVTNFINHWLIVQWWLWGTNSRGSKLKIIFLCYYFVRRKNEVCPYFLEHCLVFQYFMITIKKSCPLINLL